MRFKAYLLVFNSAMGASLRGVTCGDKKESLFFVSLVEDLYSDAILFLRALSSVFTVKLSSL